MTVGDVVLSLKGRDAGHLFCILSEEADYVWLADGRIRRLEHPKRKKRKHVQKINAQENRVCEKLKRGEKIQNRELRRILAELSQTAEEGS